MSVRAKFKVVEIARREGWSGHKEITNIKMHPVCGNSPENDAFFASTPAGEISIGCANAKATEQFEIGKEYYVDFTPAQLGINCEIRATHES